VDVGDEQRINVQALHVGGIMSSSSKESSVRCRMALLEKKKKEREKICRHVGYLGPTAAHPTTELPTH
jgi:hypothetical protein